MSGPLPSPRPPLLFNTRAARTGGNGISAAVSPMGTTVGGDVIALPPSCWFDTGRRARGAVTRPPSQAAGVPTSPRQKGCPRKRGGQVSTSVRQQIGQLAGATHRYGVHAQRKVWGHLREREGLPHAHREPGHRAAQLNVLATVDDDSNA